MDVLQVENFIKIRFALVQIYWWQNWLRVMLAPAFKTNIPSITCTISIVLGTNSAEFKVFKQASFHFYFFSSHSAAESEQCTLAGGL